MSIPIHFLNDSPHEPSDEESRCCFSTLERKETDHDGVFDTEKEFWIKYPFIKMLLSVLTAQGLPDHLAYEQAKLLGDDKAKELNDQGKALFLQELKIRIKKFELVASAFSFTNSGI